MQFFMAEVFALDPDRRKGRRRRIHEVGDALTQGARTAG